MGSVGERCTGGCGGEGRLREKAVVQGEYRKVFTVPLVAEGMSILDAISELLSTKIQTGAYIAHVYP